MLGCRRRWIRRSKLRDYIYSFAGVEAIRRRDQSSDQRGQSGDVFVLRIGSPSGALGRLVHTFYSRNWIHQHGCFGDPRISQAKNFRSLKNLRTFSSHVCIGCRKLTNVNAGLQFNQAEVKGEQGRGLIRCNLRRN